jgi:hypothetical protein
MNERIKALAEQAGMEPEDGAVWWVGNGDLEKFAKLIIEKCLGIVNRKEYSYHEADPLWETAQLIKEYFGVTE